MLRFLSDIPDYDEELRRLITVDEKNLDHYLTEFLDRILGVQVSADLSGLLQVIAWVIVAGMLLWVFYRSVLMKEFANKGTIDTDIISVDGLMGTAEDADIRGHNFVSELAEALAAEDYALAVRLRYLMTLKELDRLSAIKWMVWKTPMIYVDELEGGNDELKHITLAFLYIKYGHYPASKEVYDDVTAVSEALVSSKKGGQQ